MEKIISVEMMRRSDAWTIEHMVPSKELMFRAGKGIFEAAQWKAPVAVMCGKGNNAGDGYVTALLLHRAGIPCRIFTVTNGFSEDGKYYYDLCVREGIPAEPFGENTSLKEYGSVADCLLGTGFRGEVTGLMRRAVEAINSSGAYVVSADINSGLNGDTGEGDIYVRSDLTVSIGAFKYGHFRGQADQAMKQKVNCEIGIVIRDEKQA